MRLPPGIWISGCGVVQHKLATPDGDAEWANLSDVVEYEPLPA